MWCNPTKLEITAFPHFHLNGLNVQPTENRLLGNATEVGVESPSMDCIFANMHGR